MCGNKTRLVNSTILFDIAERITVDFLNRRVSLLSVYLWPKTHLTISSTWTAHDTPLDMNSFHLNLNGCLWLCVGDWEDMQALPSIIWSCAWRLCHCTNGIWKNGLRSVQLALQQSSAKKKKKTGPHCQNSSLTRRDISLQENLQLEEQMQKPRARCWLNCSWPEELLHNTGRLNTTVRIFQTPHQECNWIWICYSKQIMGCSKDINRRYTICCKACLVWE